MRSLTCLVIAIISILGCFQSQVNTRDKMIVNRLNDFSVLKGIDSIGYLQIDCDNSNLLTAFLKKLENINIEHLAIFSDSIVLSEPIRIKGLTTLRLAAPVIMDLSSDFTFDSLDMAYLVFGRVTDVNFLENKQINYLSIVSYNGEMLKSCLKVKQVGVMDLYGNFTSEKAFEYVGNVKSQLRVTNWNRELQLTETGLFEILGTRNIRPNTLEVINE